MANGDDPDKRYVTNKELRDMLRDRPTRWEFKAWLAGAVIANQLIPALGFGGNPTAAAVRALWMWVA